MRRKIYMQRIIAIVLSTVWLLFYLFAQYFIKKEFFTGIAPTDVQCVTQVQQVTYAVTAIRQVSDSDGNTTYRVTLRDNSNIAPECVVELTALVVGMDIGVEYAAQWLRVVGIYDSYTRIKDNISMQFNGEGVDNTVVQLLKQDVTDALVHDLRGLVKGYYYIELVVSVIVNLIVILFIQRLARGITDKIFVPCDADYAQKALDDVFETQTEQVASVTLEENIKILEEHIKRTRRRVYAKTATTTIKTLGADNLGINANANIDVQNELTKQRRVQRRELDKHKITPIADDIAVDFSFTE